MKRKLALLYNNTNSSRAASPRVGGDVGSLSGSSRSGMTAEGGNDDEPTLLHGPRRCPSVLLEITFASTTYLMSNFTDSSILSTTIHLPLYQYSVILPPLPRGQSDYPLFINTRRILMNKVSIESSSTTLKHSPFSGV